MLMTSQWIPGLIPADWHVLHGLDVRLHGVTQQCALHLEGIAPVIDRVVQAPVKPQLQVEK